MHTLTSLKTLNNSTCSQVQLQLLRCLCSSDLAFHHGLLLPTTLLDLVAQSKSFLDLEPGEESNLTSEELEEYNSYVAMLEDHAIRVSQPYEYAIAAMQALTANQFAVFQASENSEEEDIAICNSLADTFQRIAPPLPSEGGGNIGVQYKEQLHSLRLLAEISKG